MSQDWIPDPEPSQNPIPKRRTQAFTDALMQTRHGGVERARERGYSNEQVYQTAAWGQEYPDNNGRADISIFKLNSTNTPGTRRRIVVDKARPAIVTVLPREEIPEPSKPRKTNSAAATKKKKKEQLAKKRARTNGQQP